MLLAGGHSFASQVELIKLQRDPPTQVEQTALHQAVAASPQQVTVSPEELLYVQTHPLLPSASDADKLMRELEILRIRERNPQPIPVPYSGKFILQNFCLPMSVFRPIGMRAWTDQVSVRMFKYPDDLTQADRARLSGGQPSSLQFGGGLPCIPLYQAQPAPLPDNPSSSDDYSLCAERLSEYMVASNRWTEAEAKLHEQHVKYIKELFKKHPPTNVLQYDDDVRHFNHVHQRAAWGVNLPLKEKWITGKMESRLADTASTTLSETDVSGNADQQLKQLKKRNKQLEKKLKQNKKGKHNDDGSDRAEPFRARPWNKVKQVNGKPVCHKYNWGKGGCTKANCVLPSKLKHVCSYCGDTEHRLTDCDSYKTEHPADALKGYMQP